MSFADSGLNESGSIFISMYLPDNRVASSPDNIKALEPVIYISILSLIYKLSTTFSKHSTFCISSRKIYVIFLLTQTSFARGARRD